MKDFEQKVIDLGPQHVRIFYLQKWFNGEADPISEGDPHTADSFIRTCRLAQQAGASINLTNWYGPWRDIPKQMDAFAATLQHLIVDEKLDAIHYITVQNEPNLHEDKISKTRYASLYQALEPALCNVAAIACKSSAATSSRTTRKHGSKCSDATYRKSPTATPFTPTGTTGTHRRSTRLLLPREIVDALPASATAALC